MTLHIINLIINGCLKRLKSKIFEFEYATAKQNKLTTYMNFLFSPTVGSDILR